jgi:RND family efflux transporter MFP subunit
MEVERGRKRVAEREWKLLHSEVLTTQEGRRLALREPHLENAKAALSAAVSGLELAKLSLERTEIRAPFNALVTEESVDPGQLVSPQTQLARLVGTDEFWVQTALPVGQLKWIAVPGINGRRGAAAKVVHSPGNGFRIEREGRVVRLLGDLDRVGRMARLIVSVKDPMGLANGGGDGELPLLLGSYVRVEIAGRELQGVVRLPRKTVHEDDKVWVMGPDDRLQVRTIKPVWRAEQYVLVAEGMTGGERVVTSFLASPLPGMKLRVEEAREEPKAREPGTGGPGKGGDGR